MILPRQESGLYVDFTKQIFEVRDDFDPDNELSLQGIVSGGIKYGPDAAFTYGFGSLRLCRQADGVYRYPPHNLYPNSAAPVNRSVSVLSGHTYVLIITGSVSVALSGAWTGTKTAGTHPFTAGTTTLTFSSTSGSGTVQLSRTPCDTTYVATGASAVYTLPYEWDASGNCLGVLVEDTRTNLYIDNYNPVARTFAVTNSTTYTLSFFGTGSITLSGAKSETVNGTGANDRTTFLFITSGTSLTVTPSGSVSLVQVEAGAFATSPIQTAGTSVSRTFHTTTLPAGVFPYGSSGRNQGTLLMAVQQFTSSVPGGGITLYSSSTARMFMRTTQFGIYDGSNNLVGSLNSGTVTANHTTRGISTKPDLHLACINGTTQTISTSSSAMGTFSNLEISSANENRVNGWIKSIQYLPRAVSSAELAALAP